MLRILLILLWVGIFALYLRWEAYPAWFTRTIPGYRGMIPDALLTRETWARILIEGQPAGYVHTTLTMNDDQPVPVLELASRIHIRAKLLNQTRRILISFDVTLDQDYKPVRFNAFAGAGDFSLQVQAEQEQGRRFLVSTQTGDSTSTRTVTLPPDAVFYSPLQDLSLQHLRPGKSLVLRTLDPITMQTTPVVITAQPRERIHVNGKEYLALPLQAIWQGITFKSWVDEKTGTVLRQETPLGWIIETSNSDDALDAVSDEQDPPQLLRGVGALSILRMLTGANLEMDQ